MPPNNREDEEIVISSRQSVKNEADSMTSNDKCAHAPAQTRDTPDAWFTLVVVFLVNCLLGLNWVAFSVFYIHFTDNFDSHKSVTGWIGSLQTGANQMFGKFLIIFS